MYSLHGKINKIDKLIQATDNQAVNPSKDDLDLVRRKHCLLGGLSNDITWCKHTKCKEDFEESMRQLWLASSKDFKFNYKATRDCFERMKPLAEFPDPNDKTRCTQHLLQTI